MKGTRNEALADAFSGVVGTLVSLWCFYPIEFLKTNAQAGTKTKLSTESLRSAKAILRLLKRSFQGCGTKSLHATSSSFCYFYFYSMILSAHRTKDGPPLRPAKRLFLAALAAMMNTVVTLPLDVLSSKRTVQEEEEDDNTTSRNNKMQEVWDSVEQPCSTSSSSTIEVVFHEACSTSEDLLSLQESQQCHDDDENDASRHNESLCSGSSSSGTSHSILSYNEEYKTRWRQQQCLRLKPSTSTRQDIGNILKTLVTKYSKLWKGLAPALLLCSNPSIHYTVFDVLKSHRLKSQKRHLSVSEAFGLGLVSKFVATILTYPLIRAKVLMMVSSSSNSSSESPSLWSVLNDSYQRDGGWKGLYKGCNWQLLHTLLKSALMMAIREQITDASCAILRVPS